MAIALDTDPLKDCVILTRTYQSTIYIYIYVCVSRNMNHTDKYHLASLRASGAREYKKQLEWAFSAQPKQRYPEINFL